MPDQVDLADDDVADPASEPPVFVDATGRRRKIFRRVALGGGILTIGYVVVLVAALLGAPVPSPLLVPITQLGPGPAGVATTPAGVPEESTTTGAPPAPDTGSATTSAPVPAAGSSVATTAAGPVTTTAKPVPGVDHRNTHAPETPPGKTETAKKARP